jgi:hypothetical protein
MACRYKNTFENIFGRPNEGIHKYKVFGVAIVDVILTIILAALINYMLPSFGFISILIILFLLGIIIHKLLCIDTTINKLIFG